MASLPKIPSKRIAALAITLAALALAFWPDKTLTRDLAMRKAQERFHIICRRECASLGLSESMLTGPVDSPINIENKGDYEFTWTGKDDVKLNVWFATSWPGIDSGHSWRRGSTFLEPKVQAH